MMNRQHILKVVPLVLLLIPLAWWVQAQDDFGGSDRGLGGGRVLDPTQGREGELEKNTRSLVQKYLITLDAEKRAAVTDKLTATVTEHFKLRQSRRQRELDELEKELKRLKTVHEKRQKQMNSIIGRRVEALQLDANGLGWGPSGYKQDNNVFNPQNGMMGGMGGGMF